MFKKYGRGPEKSEKNACGSYKVALEDPKGLGWSVPLQPRTFGPIVPTVLLPEVTGTDLGST